MLPKFNHPQLLQTALTHRSALNERGSKSKVSNERMEYLGDAVLELATSQYLYQKFPEEPEGVLTAYRSALVKTQTLGELAVEIGLDQKLLMSKGEEQTGGRTNIGLLADTTEAVIGAIYLDQGFAAVDEFLHQHLFPKLEAIQAEGSHKDAKSQLQETVQAKKLSAPVYRVVSESGPDHNKKFVVEVLVRKKVWGRGEGKSKQQAQQAAAQAALDKSNKIDQGNKS